MITAMVCLTAVVLISAVWQSEGFVTYLEAHVQTISGTWCWQGICPKRTSFTQAKLQIKASGEKILQDQIANTLIELRPDIYLNFYSMDSSETSPITVVDVTFRQISMLVGDACRVFGTPVSVWLGVANMPTTHHGICFKGGVCAYFEGDESRLSPFTPVTSLSIYGSNSAVANGYLVWRGFTALRSR
jgi:hypothetical protein